MKTHKAEFWMRVCKDGNLPVNPSLQRLRIIYQYGNAVYSDSAPTSRWGRPCWLPMHSRNKASSIKLMREYDKVCGYKTVKIGEL